MSDVERLMAALPRPFSVVVQPASVMGKSWGACFFWPRKEIWVCVRDAAGMKATLVHEIGHARLPPGEGHSPRWEAECRRLWRDVFGAERPGFDETISCHVS
jgi:hypothetical protein